MVDLNQSDPIDRLSKLQANWDGEGSVAPSIKSLACARLFRSIHPFAKDWTYTLHPSKGVVIVSVNEEDRHLTLDLDEDATVSGSIRIHAMTSFYINCPIESFQMPIEWHKS